MKPSLLSLALALAAAPLAGCMQFDPSTEEAPQLASHVSDWRDEVIYQVLVDRFANGDYANDYNVDPLAPGKYHGGDWAGLEQHLDYMTELGVTAIWISPVVKNVETDAGFDAYHGYWAQDLTQPNEHFGDLVALRSLVKSAHEKNIKIILDIVTNHMGQLFFYDINENGQPDENVEGSGTTSSVVHINEYDPDFDPRGVQASTSLGESGPAPVIFLNDPATNHMPPMPEVLQNPAVFHRKGRTYNFDDPLQLLEGDFPGGLKDLDTTRCDVKDAMVDAYATWIEETDIDGFRIDTVKHVDRGFWRYFSQKVRQRLAADGKTNFFMFGEAFDGRDDLVGSFTLDELPDAVDLQTENSCVHDGKPITGAQLDSVFYFPQYYTAIRDVFQDGLDTQRIQDLWALRETDYGTTPQPGGIGVPPTKALVNFLDNHDVARFLFSGKPVEALRNAFTFIFTEQGIPCVYYGDEQEFKGGNDPANREDFWKTGYDTSGDTFKWVQKLIAMRKKYGALDKGDQSVVWASTRVAAEPDAGILAFERTGGDAASGAYALVVINTNATHPSSPEYNGAPMKVTAPPGTPLVDVLSGGGTFTVGADGTLAVTVPPTSTFVLVPQDQVNGN
ncbi:MAG TPA: alpha-amylase family glycosyl hydrolase [Minicystis sp.]|nr:alpha-amylase family glycosyl hydrolase [Minicystis sp.]